VNRLSDYRETAWRLMALAEHGSEGELRAELKQLSTEMAAWIMAAEIKAMTVEEPAAAGTAERARAFRWRWRRLMASALDLLVPILPLRPLRVGPVDPADSNQACFRLSPAAGAIEDAYLTGHVRPRPFRRQGHC
jgi:hypothetical protein